MKKLLVIRFVSMTSHVTKTFKILLRVFGRKSIIAFPIRDRDTAVTSEVTTLFLILGRKGIIVFPIRNRDGYLCHIRGYNSFPYLGEKDHCCIPHKKYGGILQSHPRLQLFSSSWGERALLYSP